MIHVIWDAFISLILRAVFVFALVFGVNWLEVAYFQWQTNTGQGVDDAQTALLSATLALLVILIGCAGAFRRGAAEQNFSLLHAGMALTLGAVGASGGPHVHVPQPEGGRALRRFPMFESLVLGGLFIVAWPAWWALRNDGWTWALRNAAMVGLVQILWGIWQGKRLRAARAVNAVACNTTDPSTGWVVDDKFPSGGSDRRDLRA